MSEPTRAQRRRNDRKAEPHPERRDPMVPIYVGFALALLLILGGFGIFKHVTQHQIDVDTARANATPSPGPDAKFKGVPLADGASIGATRFHPNAMGLADTANGGNGAPVDGIACETSEGVALHIHSHLALFVNGTLVQLPKQIGMAALSGTGCLYWLHTHDASGIIHVESPQLQSAAGTAFTLGNFFDIWGQPLTRTGIAGFRGPVTAYVNGARYTGALGDIPLLSHQEITLETGTPVVAPPRYVFPPGD